MYGAASRSIYSGAVLSERALADKGLGTDLRHTRAKAPTQQIEDPEDLETRDPYTRLTQGEKKIHARASIGPKKGSLWTPPLILSFTKTKKDPCKLQSSQKRIPAHQY